MTEELVPWPKGPLTVREEALAMRVGRLAAEAMGWGPVDPDTLTLEQATLIGRAREEVRRRRSNPDRTLEDFLGSVQADKEEPEEAPDPLRDGSRPSATPSASAPATLTTSPLPS